MTCNFFLLFSYCIIHNPKSYLALQISVWKAWGGGNPDRGAAGVVAVLTVGYIFKPFHTHVLLIDCCRDIRKTPTNFCLSCHDGHMVERIMKEVTLWTFDGKHDMHFLNKMLINMWKTAIWKHNLKFVLIPCPGYFYLSGY